MSVLFNREAKLILVDSPTAAKGVDLSNLRISFNITKTDTSSPNVGEIKIYNISPQTKTKLENKKIAILQVAYKGFNETQAVFESIFVGDISSEGVEVQRVGTDIVYRIICSDGELKINDAVINKSYVKGTPVSIVLNDLATALGVTIGYIGEIPTAIYSSGVSLSGKVSDILDNLCKSYKLKWTITDYKLVITSIDKPRLAYIPLITANTGLLGSVSKTKDGIKFRTLLNPKIVPLGTVSISSIGIGGVFKVTKVTHVGDTRGDDWFSEIEAVKI